MPKIRIVEKDMTANPQSFNNDTVIFIVDSGAGNIPVLLEEEIEAGTYENTEIINTIIAAGGKVLVCDNYKHAEGYLKDRNQFNVKILFVEEGAESEPGVIDTDDLESALEIVKARRDCVVVYSKKSDGYTDGEKAKLDGLLGGDEFLAGESGMVGKYVLPFYAKTLLKGSENFLPGMGYILALLYSKNQGNAEWLAIAGAKRGFIPGDLKCGFLTEDMIDSMQSRESGYSINPIVNMNPWGVRIWGNRTALQIVEGVGLQASHFANIRILICDIKKRLYQAARAYQFEQNNDVLWVNFQAAVNDLLNTMVQSYGIAGYRWIKDEEPERAKLKAILRIVPIEPVEDFDLTLELTDSLEVAE